MEIIADNLSKAGWSWGCVPTINSSGQTIFVADANRDDGRRFIVHADEKLSAFVELERQILTVTFYLESIHADSGRSRVPRIELAVLQRFKANCLCTGGNRVQDAI
jgi:hypothetical protein